MDPGRLVDRRRELEALEKALAGGGGLIAVYGRRRIGKTRLLLELARGRRAAYYQASLAPHEENVSGLAAAVEEQLHIRGAASIRDLRGLLAFVASTVTGQKLIIIDEVTYWARTGPRVVSDLQWAADHLLPGSGLTIIISGSMLGVMLQDILGGGAPLYGRASLRLGLGELPPWCVRPFAPGYTPEELVETYSFTGGVPYHLRLVDPELSPSENLARLYGPGGLLEDEHLFILRDELRDPAPYTLLLSEIARHGPVSPGKAASRAGMPSSHASTYLSRLKLLGIVREVPLLGRKRRLYIVADKPIRASILARQAPPSREDQERVLNRLASQAWEELAWLHSTSILAGSLGLKPVMAGKAVHRGEEIDWVIIDEQNSTILLVEAKWSKLDRLEINRIAEGLAAKARLTLPEKTASYELLTAVYARRAPKTGVKADAVVTPEDLPWGSCG